MLWYYRTGGHDLTTGFWFFTINPLNAELNPIFQLLALLGAHPILHVSRIRVNPDRPEVHSQNHCCCEKAISIIYFQCVSVALVTQHAKFMCHIINCNLLPVWHFSTLSH